MIIQIFTAQRFCDYLGTCLALNIVTKIKLKIPKALRKEKRNLKKIFVGQNMNQ